MGDVSDYLKRLERYALNNPVLVGFGIKDKQSFEAACTHANGAIIGTAYIKAIEHADDLNEVTKQFLNSVLK